MLNNVNRSDNNRESRELATGSSQGCSCNATPRTHCTLMWRNIRCKSENKSDFSRLFETQQQHFFYDLYISILWSKSQDRWPRHGFPTQVASFRKVEWDETALQAATFFRDILENHLKQCSRRSESRMLELKASRAKITLQDAIPSFGGIFALIDNAGTAHLA